MRKNKLLAGIVLATAMSLMLAGCEKKTDADAQNAAPVQEQNTTEEQTTTEEQSADPVKTETSESEQEAQTAEADMPPVAETPIMGRYIDCDSEGLFWILGEDGTSAKRYYYNDLGDSESKQNWVSFLYAYGDIAIVYEYDWDNNKEDPYQVYAVSLTTGKRAFVFGTDCYPAVSYFGGMFSIYSEESDYSGSVVSYTNKSVLVKIDEETMTVTTVHDYDFDYSKLKSMPNLRICNNGYYNNYTRKMNPEEQIARRGWILCVDNETRAFWKLTKDGGTEKLPYSDYERSVIAQNSDYVIWNLRKFESEESYYTVDCGIMVYDVATGKDATYEVRENSVIGLEGNAFYYFEENGSDTTGRQFVVKRLNLTNGSIDTVVEYKRAAGMMMSGGGRPGLAVAGDYLYYVNDSEIGSELKRCSLETGNIETVAADSITYDFMKYGRMEYASKLVECDYCDGGIGYGYRNTYFYLSDSYPGAAKANAELSAFYSAQEKEAMEFSFGEEDCEIMHSDSNKGTPSYYIDWDVNAIQMLKENTICIEFDGYWDAGGVHGYPLLAQYVFDVTTGERITFESLYTGSQEDFVRIAAEETVKEFNRQKEDSDDTYFFAETAEDLYNEVITYSFDQFNVELKQDGVVILYSPYELGPYASGYISIDIPYELLGITF